jgi:transcriptional regulator with XRE-family HTH domain
MSKVAGYRKFLESVRSGVGYWKSYSLLQFTLSLTRLMKLEKVSGRALASRLGISAAQVSKVLRGNENVTIETMAKFADALGAVVHIHVAKKGVAVEWRETPAESSSTRVVLSSLPLDASPAEASTPSPPAAPSPAGAR